MSFPDGCRATRRRGPPSLRSAAALLLLLPLLPPPAAAAPLSLAAASDSSGEAEPEEAGARRAALPDCEALAWLLHARAARLQEEMCEKFTVCENSMEMLVQNNLNLPKVTEEDGCLLAGFDEARNRSLSRPNPGSSLGPAPKAAEPKTCAHSLLPTCPYRQRSAEATSELELTFSPFSFQEKCLKKLSSGLFTFQTYLEYVQETFTSEKQKVESLYYSTKHLATTIRQMVINPDEVVIPDSATQKSLLTKLKSDKTWIEKITTHLILRDFTSFMEKTVRAVRYLKNTRSFSV
ncbi:interleukin-6 isoform X1 [Cygnus olor]|uniref:interleukin-6 isoform X1 n=1 Tax=Cygnus olor TaxID=8869 RepID=UPI001ADEA573|nr:interleukin-6 isoform X1 [Cygnus olor]